MNNCSASVPAPTASGWEDVGTSVQGRPIRVQTVGHGPRKVLFIGGIHGDEPEGAVATAELPAAFETAGLDGADLAGSSVGGSLAAFSASVFAALWISRRPETDRLPAGALADFSNRRNLLIAVYLWLGAAAGLLAVCTWLHWVHPYVILTTVFLLGIGFAFNAPVWASVVPEIVQKEELASAITLGGVQMNLSGIAGPALGGLLLPIVGPAMLFSLNALAFLTMAWVVSQRYHRRGRPEPHLENFLESFATAAP